MKVSLSYNPLFFIIISLILIILKEAGIVHISWALATFPFWGSLILFIIVCIYLWITIDK